MLVVLDDEKDRVIILGLKVNGNIVFDALGGSGEAETWSSAMFGNRVIKEHGDDDIKEVEVLSLKATSQVASECLVAMI